MPYENSAFNNNDNKGNNDYRVTFYSPVKMKNPSSTVDPSELSFRFWKGLLGITISPKIEKSNTDYDRYDHENNTIVYINHTKARMLYTEMEALKANPDTYNSVGISSGPTGLISVCNGKEVGVNGPVLIVRKLDSDGNIQSSFMYEFNKNYHFSIRNFDESSLKYDKHYYDDLEYDEFMSLLRCYFENASAFIAYSTIDAMRFDNSRINTKVELIMDKLEIPKQSGRRNQTGTSKSFFDMANQGSVFAESAAAGVPDRTVNTATLDDLEG